jgi:hypothetical protein
VHRVRRRDVPQIEAAREVPRGVSLREIAGPHEHLIEIQRYRQEPLAVEIIPQLPLDGADAFPMYDI